MSLMTSFPEGSRQARTSPSPWVNSGGDRDDFGHIGLDLDHPHGGNPRLRSVAAWHSW